MERGLSVRELALRIGKPESEVLRAARELGYEPGPAGRLGLEVADRIRRYLEADAELLFVRAMAAAGVVPLDSPERRRPGGRGRKRSRKVSRPARGAGPVAAQGPAAAAAGVGGGEEVRPGAELPVSPAGEGAPAGGGSATPAPGGSPGRDEPAGSAGRGTGGEEEQEEASGEIEQLRREKRELEERLERMGREYRALEERSVALERERDELAAVVSHLSARLEERDRDAETPGTNLLSLFAQRGLKGPDELTFAFRSMLENRLLDRIYPLLEAARPERFSLLLEERLMLVCGRPGCEPVPGTASVLVPPQRCELCGGHGARAVFRAFNDACLLSGVRQVLLVGGAPPFQRWIRAGVDPRIELRVVPGLGPSVSEVVRQDAGWAQVILLWALRAMSRETMALFDAAPAPVVRVNQWSAGGFLVEAAEAIGSIDPALFPAPRAS